MEDSFSKLRAHKHNVSFIYSKAHKYDIYKFPASKSEAIKHKRATRLGKLGSGVQPHMLCPCCKNPMIHAKFRVCCDTKDLADFSPALTIYFKFLKFISTLISSCISFKFLDIWRGYSNPLQDHQQLLFQQMRF